MPRDLVSLKLGQVKSWSLDTLEATVTAHDQILKDEASALSWANPSEETWETRMNLLFVCSQNKLRSPTAEHHFSQPDGIDALSAGTNSSADVTLSGDLVEWADIVFCMEEIHARKVRERYGRHLRGRIVCIDVPDRYSYMQPELVELLASRVRPHLR